MKKNQNAYSIKSQVKLFSLLLFVASSTLLAGCHNHDHQHEAEEQNEHRHSANGVEFPHEMSESIDFAVAPAEMRQVGNVIRTVAKVQPAQGDELVLTAKADGIVRLSKSNLASGVELKAGETICSINASATAGSNLEAQQQQARAEWERAQNELQRMENLRAEKLVLESELQRARADYAQAKAQLDALQKGFSHGTQPVSAPQAGYLKELRVQEGQFVSTGEVVAVVVQNQRLQLQAEVPARRASDLKQITGANVHPLNSAETFSLQDLNGKLIAYARQSVGNSAFLPVSFEVDATDAFVVGTMVDLYIQTQGTKESLCVSATSVLEEMGNYFVYVQVEPEFYEKRQVRLGATDGLYTEILSGLESGQMVISRGAVMVKLQQSSGSVDAHAGHNH